MSETATLKVASRTLIVNGCYNGHVTTEERTSRLEGAYEQVNERLGEIRVELAGMNQRFDTLHRTMLAGLGLILAALVGLSFV